MRVGNGKQHTSGAAGDVLVGQGSSATLLDGNIFGKDIFICFHLYRLVENLVFAKLPVPGSNKTRAVQVGSIRRMKP
jgi:hypothetical protein